MTVAIFNVLWWLWPAAATAFTVWSAIYCLRAHRYLWRVQAEDRAREEREAIRANPFVGRHTPSSSREDDA